MRRRAHLPLLLLVLGLAAGCGSGGDVLATAVPVDDSALSFRGATGLTLLDPDDGRVTRHVDRGVRSGDGRWVFGTRLTAAGTKVEAVAADGSRTWSTEVPGDLDVRAVSTRGDLLALQPSADRGEAYAPKGRTSTTMTIVSTRGEPVRAIELAGNYEPEAFTADGESLFVIEYLPAHAPDRYRVRRLDLATGDVSGVHSLDGHLQEAMRGTARVQALAASGTRLYTLYTIEEGGTSTAFVHVLDLVEGWAHCVDLPDGVGGSPEGALAVTTVPARRSVAVVDADAGTWAEIDEATLAVTPLGHLGGGDTIAGLRPVSATSLGDRVFVGAGDGITVIDLALDPGFVVRWALDAPVVDVRADAERGRLWVASPGALRALDVADGGIVDGVAAPDIGADGVEAPPPVDDGRGPIQCAC